MTGKWIGKKAIAWCLVVCMLFSMLPADLARAKTDEATGEITGLVAMDWLEYDESGEVIMTENGQPGFYDEENENRLEEIPYNDYREVSYPGASLWLDFIDDDGTKTHVTWGEVDVQYYGDDKDFSQSDTRCTVLKNEQDPRLIDFTPKGEGWFCFSYTGTDIDEEKDLWVWVSGFPDIGFYKTFQTGYDDKRENLSYSGGCNGFNYTCDYYKGYDDNKTYVNLYAPLEGNTKLRLASGEDGEKPPLELRYWDNEEECEKTVDSNDKEIDDWLTLGEEIDLSSTAVSRTNTNLWYEITFSPAVDVDNFSLCVHAIQTVEYEDIGETFTYEADCWMDVICYNYEGGVYAKKWDESYRVYDEDTPMGGDVNPYMFRISFEEVSVTEDNDTTDGSTIRTYTKRDMEFSPVDVTVVKWDEENQEWMKEPVGEEFLDITPVNSAYLELVFYQEGRYRISTDIGDFVVEAWLATLGFYDEPVRPDDGSKINTFLGRKTVVRQHQKRVIHMLTWYDATNPDCVDMSTVSIKAYDRNGEELRDYIHVGDAITKDNRTVGYTLEITDRVEKSFEIRATAQTIQNGMDEEGNPVTYEPYEVEDILKVNLVNLDSIEITTAPAKTVYTAGETFDKTGMVVTAHYTDGSTADILEYTMQPEGALAVSDQKVTVSYYDKTAECTIIVNAANVPPDNTSSGNTGTADTPPSGNTAAGNTGNTPSGGTTSNPTPEPPETTVEVGTKVEDAKTGSYKVTGIAEDGTLEVVYTPSKSLKKASKVAIKESVIIDGVEYKVTALADNAFSGNKKLTKVTIPDTVTVVGKNAFKKCTSLKSIKLPLHLTTIKASAFTSCKALKKVSMKSTEVSSIGKSAFKGIAKKAVITVPKAKKAEYKKLLKKSGYKGTIK